MRTCCILLTVILTSLTYERAIAQTIAQPAGTWVKRSPLDGTPVSPRLGYEGACVWDSVHRVMIRYGGHNQGGGGEQGSEIWLFDPLSARWTLKLPNTSPPGICCGQQNVFDPVGGRYVRFPAFSGSHGWQWFREIYMNDASVWTYDLQTNVWRNMRPLPTPNPRPLRCASWDSDQQVIVMFGGEGSSDGTWTYDPHLNTWKRMSPPSQPEPRSAGNMAYDAQRKLHILFGSQFSDDQHTWAYSLSENVWTDMRPTRMPHTDRNDAVLCYDSINKVVLAVVKITTGKDDESTHRLETWSYDAGKNEWTKLNPPQEPDPTSNRARQLMFAPELNAAILENRTGSQSPPGAEQQIWTYRYADGPAVEAAAGGRVATKRSQPPVVDDVVVSVVAAQRVELKWLAAKSDDVVGYHVERAAVEVWTEDQLTRLKSQTPPLAEPSVGAIRRIGAFEQLTGEPLKQPQYVDTTIDLTKPRAIEGEPIYDRNMGKDSLDESGAAYRFAVFAYRVRAVNKAGVSSGPSAAVLTIPSAPQHVFSKEDGTTCHLKWAANPESGLRGYRVYRMDGRFNKEPIPRLSAEPITATTFADTEAGKASRRYYIVAVDALGQEGFPSAPAWFNREWQQFYVPFVGEWHQ
jgi:hypothetical protein